MIPLENKELLINKLEEGMTLQQACRAAKVPRASLYRLFKDFPAYKELIDKTIEKTKKKKEETDLAFLKKLVVKK